MLQRRLFNLTLNILEVGHLKRSFNYISVQPLTPPLLPGNSNTGEKKKSSLDVFFSNPAFRICVILLDHKNTEIFSSIPWYSMVDTSTVEPCPDDLFTCGDGGCALQAWTCDGDLDCEDGSDEQGCRTYYCQLI